MSPTATTPRSSRPHRSAAVSPPRRPHQARLPGLARTRVGCATTASCSASWPWRPLYSLFFSCVNRPTPPCTSPHRAKCRCCRSRSPSRHSSHCAAMVRRLLSSRRVATSSPACCWRSMRAATSTVPAYRRCPRRCARSLRPCLPHGREQSATPPNCWHSARIWSRSTARSPPSARTAPNCLSSANRSSPSCRLRPPTPPDWAPPVAT